MGNRRAQWNSRLTWLHWAGQICVAFELHILDNFPCFFTSAHSEADFRQITQAWKDSVIELQEADFLPRRTATARTVMDARQPPLPGARIGREPDGRPAWFVQVPGQPGSYTKAS